MFCFFSVIFLCAALGTQLWTSEVSSHHSISAACEYSILKLIKFWWVHFLSTSLLYYIISLAFRLCQGSRVHVEQVKPAEKRSPEFSYAAGVGIRPHPPRSSWAPSRSPGQASVWSHSNCQAVYGGTGPWQHSNRGPNEPPTSLENKGQEKN